MNRGPKGCLIAAVCGAGVVFVILFAIYWAVDGSASWPRGVRYRLTLTVETPEGIKTGSSVIETTEHYADAWVRGPMTSGGWVRFRGQAPMVELGKRGLLFLVFQNDLERDRLSGRPLDLPARYFHDLDPDRGWSPDLFDKLNTLRPPPKRDIAPDDLPLLVTFRDPKDSTTIEKVAPDHLDAKFGPGVKLIGATIEVTTDPMTSGLEKKLPWLLPYDATDVVGGKRGQPNASQEAALLHWDFWGKD